jgi:hypothetical protein
MVPSVATEEIPSDTTGDRSRDPPTNSAVTRIRTKPFSAKAFGKFFAWSRFTQNIC